MNENIMYFLDEIREICTRRNILIGGKLRILDAERYVPNTQETKFVEVIEDGLTRDRTGPFIFLSAELKPAEITSFGKSKYNTALLNVDKDKLLKDGVKSSIDGSIHTNRKTYGDHLKAHGCREVGNDYNNAQAKFVSNHEFDDKGLYEATARAVDEVFDRKKIKTLR
jgi:hypothetical protein